MLLAEIALDIPRTYQSVSPPARWVVGHFHLQQSTHRQLYSVVVGGFGRRIKGRSHDFVAFCLRSHISADSRRILAEVSHLGRSIWSPRWNPLPLSEKTGNLSRSKQKRQRNMEQTTTSNNPVIWHCAEFQEQIESLLLLVDHFFFLFALG